MQLVDKLYFTISEEIIIRVNLNCLLMFIWKTAQPIDRNIFLIITILRSELFLRLLGRVSYQKVSSVFHPGITPIELLVNSHGTLSAFRPLGDGASSVIGEALLFLFGSFLTEILESLVTIWIASSRADNPLCLIDEPLIRSIFQVARLPLGIFFPIDEVPMESIDIASAHLKQPVTKLFIIEVVLQARSTLRTKVGGTIRLD
jgi:hypothetical protein